MKRQIIRTCLALLLCVWLIGLHAGAALALTFIGGGSASTGGGAPDSKNHVVELGDCVIGAGEIVSYTTIDVSFPSDIASGNYSGELTISLKGDVVIESGGELGIGTLSIGGSESSPVLRAEGGSITVEAGGRLSLTGVVLEPQEDAAEPFLLQKDGGLLTALAMDIPEGAVGWGAPLVDNTYRSPDDLLLPEGTALTEEMLPETLFCTLQHEGKETDKNLAVSWELSAYDGQSSGELTLTGQFLDEEGAVVLSFRPLELTVRWYRTQELLVSDAEWKGGEAAAVTLTVQNLPDPDSFYGDIWGEVSADGGETWEAWEEGDSFSIAGIQNSEAYACIFAVPDSTARWFRVCAQEWRNEAARWESAWYEVSPDEEDDDISGNRGGSTSPNPPYRLPALAADPGEETDEPPAADSPDGAEQETVQEEGGTASGGETAPEAEPETDEDAPPPALTAPEQTPSAPDAAAVNSAAEEEAEFSDTAVEEPPLAGAENDAAEETLELKPEHGFANAEDLEDAEKAEPGAGAPETEETAHMEAEQQKESKGLPLPAQAGLAAGALALCCAGGMAYAGVGPFKAWRR